MGNSGIGLDNPLCTPSGQKLFVVKLFTTEERMRELARSVGFVRKRGGKNPRRPVNKMVEIEMGVTEEMMIKIAKEVGFISSAQVRQAIQEGAAETAHDILTPKLPIDLPAALARRERQYLVEAMRRAEGNKAAAGRLLGLKRTTVIAWLIRHSVEEAEYSS